MIPIMVTVVTVAITIVILTFRTWLDDMTRQWQIDEDLYGCVIVQDSCVQDAGIKESWIFDASGFASRDSVRCLLAGEVTGIERLCGNAEPNARLPSEQGLTRRHTPAFGVGMVQILEEHRRLQQDSAGRDEFLGVSERIAEKTSYVRA